MQTKSHEITFSHTEFMTLISTELHCSQVNSIVLLQLPRSDVYNGDLNMSNSYQISNFCMKILDLKTFLLMF